MAKICPEVEKNLILSAQNFYDILDMAMQAGDDGGFINEFVYDRAAYVFFISMIMPQHKTQIAEIISEGNPLEAWTYCCDEGIAEELFANERYAEDIKFLEEKKTAWLENYCSYAHSARGIINIMQELSADIVGETIKRFKSVNEGSDVQRALEIAESWGLNNVEKQDSINEFVQNNTEPKPKILEEMFDTSLFEQVLTT